MAEAQGLSRIAVLSVCLLEESEELVGPETRPAPGDEPPAGCCPSVPQNREERHVSRPPPGTPGAGRAGHPV